MPHAVFIDVTSSFRAALDQALATLGIARGEATSPSDAGARLHARHADLIIAPSYDVARGALDSAANGAGTAVIVIADDRAAAAAALRAGADAVIDVRDPVELIVAHIDRAFERARGRTVLAAAGKNGDGPKPLEEVARTAAEDAERRHIVTVLASVRGNRTRAAGLLGVARSTLWHKLRRYGLEAGAPGESAAPVNGHVVARP